MQRRAHGYDKSGDAHYDTISAFIKTIRGSDPDAAVYWLARMIESGEDPLFIARRLVILASEDVGLADRGALPIAMAAQQAVHFVGMPEGFFPLAHATLYLATAPKSNTVGRAYGAALADVQSTRNDPVPLHLRNAPTQLMKHLGYGEGYRYAHDDYAAMHADGDLPPAVALQSNLPEALGERGPTSTPAVRETKHGCATGSTRAGIRRRTTIPSGTSRNAASRLPKGCGHGEENGGRPVLDARRVTMRPTGNESFSEVTPGPKGGPGSGTEEEDAPEDDEDD